MARSTLVSIASSLFVAHLVSANALGIEPEEILTAWKARSESQEPIIYYIDLTERELYVSERSVKYT